MRRSESLQVNAQNIMPFGKYNFLGNILILLSGLFIFLFFFNPIETEDVWWHISTGKWIIEHGQVPHVDIFPFANEITPWSCHNEWLGSTILYLVVKFLGFFGLRLFRALFFILIIGVLFRYAYKRLPFLVSSILIFLVAFGLSSRAFLKPDLFNMLFIQIFLINLINYEDSGDRKSLWVLPAVSLVWFNIHLGAFVYGILLVGIFFVSSGIRYLNLHLRKGDPVEKTDAIKKVKDLAITLGACLASFIFNPYGIEGFLYPFKIFLFPEYIGFYKSSASVQEMQPPWYIFHSLNFFYYFALFALASFVLSLNKKNNLTLFILLSFATVAFLCVGRNSVLFTIICAYIFVVGAARIRFNDIWQSLRYQKIIEYVLFLGIVVFLLSHIAGILFQRGYYNGQFVNDHFIQESPYAPGSIKLLIENKITGPVLNSDALGGEIIWLGYPDLRPFRDGRNNSNERINNGLLTLINPQENWPKVERAYKFKIVILDPYKAMEKRFIDYLSAQPTWQLIAVNGPLVTYVKRGAFNLPKELDTFEVNLKARHVTTQDLNDLKKLVARKSSMVEGLLLPRSDSMDLFYDFSTLNMFGYSGAAIEKLIKTLEVSNRSEIRGVAEAIIKQLESFAHASYIEYNNRANLYNGSGNYAQAILEYSKAIELKPDLEVLYQNRGASYYKQGKFIEALADFNKAIQLKANYTEAYQNRAVTYYQLKDYKKSWNDLEKLKQLGFSFPVLHQALQKVTGRNQ